VSSWIDAEDKKKVDTTIQQMLKVLEGKVILLNVLSDE
jgi:hypothetical protein